MLNEIQKNAVRSWVADGSGLSSVQQRIKDEFGVSMTYMEVRLLVIELNATLQDKPEPKPAEPEAPKAPAQPVQDDFPAEEPALPETERSAVPDDMPADGFSQSSLSVTFDRVMRAGALASGEVTFSDGVTGSWFIDRFGRLSLTKVSKENYQPSREDLEAFQIELQKQFSGGGY